MSKIKDFFKKNSKLLLGLPIGLIIGGAVTYVVADTILFASGSVSYSNTESGLTSTTVQGAIDELYTKAMAFECKDGYVKQNETSDSYECVLPPICKAVTNAADLHTEPCNYTSGNYYCYADGYTGSNSTITYGSIWDGDVEHLAPGNAFDCDINNNKIYGDKVNGISVERFYYVGDYYNQDGTSMSTATFDEDYAVLIYYKNFALNTEGTDVEPSFKAAAYAAKKDIVNAGFTVSSSDNWHGPQTAIKNLPKTTGDNAWRDDLLKTRERTIKACDDQNCTTISNATSGGTITPNPFNYGSTTAARLLTVQEIKHAGCDTLSGKTSLGATGALKACNFLFEGTKYANTDTTTYPTNGPWCETPSASASNNVWGVSGLTRYANYYGTNNLIYGVRPAIDVPKTKLARESGGGN